MKRLISILIIVCSAGAVMAQGDYTPVKREDAFKTVVQGTTTVGIGAKDVTNSTSAIENGDGIVHQTVITLAGVAMSIADGAFQASQLIYTMPEGRILVEGVTVDLTAVTTTNFNPSVADLYNFAIGTVVNADGDGTIGATSANLLANQSVDTACGVTTSAAIAAALAASAQFDGTTTAIPVYLNWAIPAANDKGLNTLTPTGTITITWKSLGDY